jgi:hypothetical protein
VGAALAQRRGARADIAPDDIGRLIEVVRARIVA